VPQGQYMITHTQVRIFKSAVKSLIYKYECEGKRDLKVGLCYTISDDTYINFLIMSKLLTMRQSIRGLGPLDVFTKNRYHFLLLLNIMSVDDYLEICNSDEVSDS
jgi:hypothetical protein